ncbi:PLP-dependent transferase [Diaphorobacter caeni]|uniref:PLP-dependent transferase n=1 Tax=Diaphorobacter caeni TaxID=2784387 RepID=UPI00189015FB|nr:PLP-dependent transferase [Diaphorobacter caeni]MBF5004471.1 PLP-dependent transferase [Diaphorobacter caeni]
MTQAPSSQDIVTDLIHHGYEAPGGFAAPQPPVCKASTVFFPNVAAMRDFDWKDKSAYTYGLHGTPTSYVLEERIAALEGGLQCLLVPSGLAAIATVSLSLLKQGDEVLIPDNAYGPNKALAEVELKHFGISHRYFDPLNPADLEAKITPATKLVWLEAPGSVTLEFPDLLAQVRICRDRKLLCVLDNTWGAGLAFPAFDLLRDGGSLGVDVSVHALTKYPSGGGDVLMGGITTRDLSVHMKLKLTHMRIGFGVGMNDVEAVLRSLPSMALRYHAHDKVARELAQWMGTQTAVVQVLHPALAGSPGHEQWKALCCTPGNPDGAAAGLFSVVIDPKFSQEQIDRFCDSLRYFKIGYSWGGPISLVVPYDLPNMRSLPSSGLKQGTIVRFSIGLEAARDLQADLAQALKLAFGA